MTTLNFENYRTTDDVLLGLASLFHDGTSITSGSEPKLLVDPVYSSRWTVEFWVKVADASRMCLLSIPDGTGNRYFDVYIEGDKVTTYFHGTEDVLTYTTDATPLADWFHVAVCSCPLDDQLWTAANGVSLERTTFVDIAPNTTEMNLFKPVHESDNCFHGYIGHLRVRNNAALYRNPTYNINVVSSYNWVADSSHPVVGVDDMLLQCTELVSNSGSITKHFHSWTHYDDTSAICSSRSNDVILATPRDSFPRAPWSSGITARGMHYFRHSNRLLAVDGNSGDIKRFDVDGSATSIVNNGGIYKSGRGDHEDKYFFGWKVASDGSTNQIFRMDEYGLNEITVDVISLTGKNENAYGFALDDDEYRVFFHDQTTQTLRSIGYDLSVESHTTWPHTLPVNDWGDIDYCQGFVFYGGIDPGNGSLNSKMYRIELSTNEVLQLGGVNQSIRGGFEGTVDVFIHRARNELWLATEATKPVFVTGDNFDFFTAFMTAAVSSLGTVDISWMAVEGATSYNLLQDGVVIGTTSENTLNVTGLGNDGTRYRFTLESSEDGTTYTTPAYYKVVHTSAPRFSVQKAQTQTNWPDISFFGACLGTVDPYNPKEFVIVDGGHLCAYNVETDTTRVLAPMGISLNEKIVATRAWSSKSFYYVPALQSTDIYELGVECENLLNYATEQDFLSDTSNRVFSASEPIRCLTSAFEQRALYYGTSTGLRRVNVDGTGDSLVLPTPSWIRGIGIDPHNADCIVYSSSNNLWHHDLSTSTTTQITSTSLHTQTHDIEVLDGTIYGQFFSRPFNTGLFTLRTDGSGYLQVRTESFNGNVARTSARRFLTNHENKSIFALDRQISQTTLYDANMPLLPTDPGLLSITPNPIGLDVEWGSISGAVHYGVRYSVGEAGIGLQTGGSLNIPSDRNRFRIRGLQQHQTYTVYFYYTADDAVSTLVTFKTVQTLRGEGGVADYDRDFFESENSSGFDLTTLSTDNLAVVSEVLNDLFSTGDEISIPVNGRSVPTTLVRRGDSVTVEDGLSLAIPFTTSSGTDQTASLVLSDDSTVTVAFDETTANITVNGDSYTSGESFILDGRKVSLYDV
ncbi:unnamed protein product [Ectocarpus sp. 6 AP-2014]